MTWRLGDLRLIGSDLFLNPRPVCCPPDRGAWRPFVALLCKDPVDFGKFPLDLVRASDLLPPAPAGGMRGGNKSFDAGAAAGAPRWVVSL
jgi:hypothetical protein